MKKENIVTRKWGDRRKGKTDWARVDALTDEDIAKAVANDPDAAPIDIDWSDAVLVIPAKKKAISIRVDEDVLDEPILAAKRCLVLAQGFARHETLHERPHDFGIGVELANVVAEILAAFESEQI